MTLTVTDLFCDAGGSSQGAEDAGGQLAVGLNHWRRAIDTHAANFPHGEHDCADVSACDPRYCPSTDLLIASPECDGRWAIVQLMGHKTIAGRITPDELLGGGTLLVQTPKPTGSRSARRRASTRRGRPCTC